MVFEYAVGNQVAEVCGSAMDNQVAEVYEAAMDILAVAVFAGNHHQAAVEVYVMETDILMEGKMDSVADLDMMVAEVPDSIDPHLHQEFHCLVHNIRDDHCHWEKRKRFLF